MRFQRLLLLWKKMIPQSVKHVVTVSSWLLTHGGLVCA